MNQSDNHTQARDSVFYARNCIIRRIDKACASTFLEANHMYGDCSAQYRYGIFVNRYSGAENTPGAEHPWPIGTLVAVASFSSGRNWVKGNQTIRSYEWLRYASLQGLRIAGGMGKILSAFIEDVHPDDIMTYAPAEHFTGDVYETLGFKREGIKTFPGGSSIKFRLKLTQY